MPSPLALRKRARSLIIQSLYEWQVANNPTPEIAANALSSQRSKVDEAYYREALYQIKADVTQIDGHITPFLDRDLSEVSPVELAVLRLACYEFLNRLDVPYKVVIDESLNNVRKFGAAHSHKFVNGVLDKLAGKLRMLECKKA